MYRPSAEDAFLFRGHDRPEAVGGLRLVSWNIHWGAGPELEDSRRFDRQTVSTNLQRMAEVLRREEADIVALQEVDRDSMRSAHIDQLEILRDSTGLRHASFATTWDAAWVPHPVAAPPRQQFGRMWSGQAVLSRFPVVEQRRHALAQPSRFGRVYNRFYLHRCVQEVVLDLGRGRRLTILNVHLEAFDQANRRQQARTLAALMGRVRGPGVVMGDLNTVPPESGRFTGFDDEPDTDFQGDDTLQTLEDCGWTRVGGVEDTFPAGAPNRRLDHLLVNAEVEVVEVDVVADPGPSSDHLPLGLTIR
ncbi:MAG TPA: endonuclease/exonuclease/phosphatase family protein [Myxococcota bacterium]|nr:endonuclease/exonuclease/phosphatase family protein [Myxococcota bacterium]